MSIVPLNRSPADDSLKQIWFTRCPVPTATGLAYKLGWLTESFASKGISIATLQDAPRELARHHYDHRLPELIREGGNILALAARAQGEATRLVGLTWIEEWQTILVRSDSNITEPLHLKGLRLALPSYADNPIAKQVRGTSIARAMSLHGYKGVLASAGLTFDDVSFVEVSSSGNNQKETLGATPSSDLLQELWAVQALVDGKVDAVYVKGASASDAARRHGVVVGVDIDKLSGHRFRVNNGTPRPITVHESLLENHFDIVVGFLYQTLRAADWASENLAAVQKILEGETWGSKDGVAEAYRDGFHQSLHPDLSEGRLALLDQQKKFLWTHGFLEHDFDLAAWTDHRALAEAYKLIAQDKV